MLRDIKGYHTFVKIEPVNKGLSDDQKFHIETADGENLLLRVSDLSKYERKRAEYDVIRPLSALYIPMSRPVDCGSCNNGKSVYQLLTWCQGEDAADRLATLSIAQQYVLGFKTGELLQKIHTVSAPSGIGDWSSRFHRDFNDALTEYRKNGLHFDGDDTAIAYVKQNAHLVNNRPQTLLHGDFHINNLIATPSGISLIDFDDVDYGDPWADFESIRWAVEKSSDFATGQVRGYFGGEPPEVFWQLFALYICADLFSNLMWSYSANEKEFASALRQVKDIMTWFDNFENPVPSWYVKDICIQTIDGIPYRLKSPFDFSFIRKYGTVFQVFDNQDSGNICFGIQGDDGKRSFVKFAGAATARYDGRTVGGIEGAIARLKATVSIYRDLAHPTLNRFIKAEDISGGFAVVFDWVDAICAHPMYPSDFRKFQELPMPVKERIFRELLTFHAHVIKEGYVAIDFYDGSILWDLENARTIICDIDFYAKRPYINHMGRLWGSKRFMSPEEFRAGALIDEVTNVYTMGAPAFCLFSSSKRTLEAWPLSPERYTVVKKATSDDKRARQQSIEQLIEEWEAAK
jgi:serine/threonine-protein kinase